MQLPSCGTTKEALLQNLRQEKRRWECKFCFGYEFMDVVNQPGGTSATIVVEYLLTMSHGTNRRAAAGNVPLATFQDGQFLECERRVLCVGKRSWKQSDWIPPLQGVWSAWMRSWIRVRRRLRRRATWSSNSFRLEGSPHPRRKRTQTETWWAKTEQDRTSRKRSASYG